MYLEYPGKLSNISIAYEICGERGVGSGERGAQIAPRPTLLLLQTAA
ncbi:hypothetical protein Cha6605_5205 [Chamaesiphon minutus PCC 6605]|uniref:Uncharacterized protein n=1 Tax=Chamaesiphon minutus (strain ATCC 27169 / PCC 6605) TaxID=1173020 RepID=K9UNS4_CHAP6|nr:hypothetical protein Cha6605_5205 [Chamaesiphon minutus PCC 6605]